MCVQALPVLRWQRSVPCHMGFPRRLQMVVSTHVIYRLVLSPPVIPPCWEMPCSHHWKVCMLIESGWRRLAGLNLHSHLSWACSLYAQSTETELSKTSPSLYNNQEQAGPTPDHVTTVAVNHSDHLFLSSDCKDPVKGINYHSVNILYVPSPDANPQKKCHNWSGFEVVKGQREWEWAQLRIFF